VSAFLLDEGRQLGIANVGTFYQVAMRVIVMQNGQWNDRTAGIRSFTVNTTVQGAITFRSLVGSFSSAVMLLDVGINGIEHVSPVGDVGHVLETVITITTGRSQELVGSHFVYFIHLKRFADPGIPIDHAHIISAPGVRLRTRIGIFVTEVAIFQPGRLDHAGDIGGVINYFQNVRAGHFSHSRGIAEGQNGEHVAISQQTWIVYTCDTTRIDPGSTHVTPIGADASGIVEKEVDIICRFVIRV